MQRCIKYLENNYPIEDIALTIMDEMFIGEPYSWERFFNDLLYEFDISIPTKRKTVIWYEYISFRKNLKKVVNEYYYENNINLLLNIEKASKLTNGSVILTNKIADTLLHDGSKRIIKTTKLYKKRCNVMAGHSEMSEEEIKRLNEFSKNNEFMTNYMLGVIVSNKNLTIDNKKKYLKEFDVEF